MTPKMAQNGSFCQGAGSKLFLEGHFLAKNWPSLNRDSGARVRAGARARARARSRAPARVRARARARVRARAHARACARARARTRARLDPYLTCFQM